MIIELSPHELLLMLRVRLPVRVCRAELTTRKSRCIDLLTVNPVASSILVTGEGKGKGIFAVWLAMVRWFMNESSFVI